jgi:CheY-like chemotaxis protein
MEASMDTETMNAQKILLVEDDPQDVKLTLAGLGENDLASKVVVVRDGAEALDYLHRRRKFKARPPGNPILLLLDNKMPKVGGLEVLKTIKIDEQLKTIPVVALTSSRETRDLIEFYKYGVNAYVVKPMDFSAYMQVIKQLGIFWTTVNEPPPIAWSEEISIQDDEASPPGKIEVENGFSTPHPALGG